MKALWAAALSWGTKYLDWILIAALAGALAGCVVLYLMLAAEEKGRAQDGQRYADEKAAAATKALQDSDKLAQRVSKAEQEAADAKRDLQDRQQDLERANATVGSLRARIDVLAGDGDRLRRNLRAYAAGGPGDTADACRARAEQLAAACASGAEIVRRLAGRLEGCVRLAGDAAVDAAAGSIEVDKCVAAWPRLSPRPPAAEAAAR